METTERHFELFETTLKNATICSTLYEYYYSLLRFPLTESVDVCKKKLETKVYLKKACANRADGASLLFGPPSCARGKIFNMVRPKVLDLLRHSPPSYNFRLLVSIEYK